LTPQDLLSLYRTNKGLRDRFGSPHAAHDWKVARQNVRGLPYRPHWLTEPQFVALCFDDHCQKCLAPTHGREALIQWSLNARYCMDCLETQ
ncbi:hypothetical protein BV20DRAFT_937276, partial [Pilatotrama ljubarskyi]